MGNHITPEATGKFRIALLLAITAALPAGASTRRPGSGHAALRPAARRAASLAQNRPATPPARPDDLRLPRQSARTTAALQGIVRDASDRAVIGARITLIDAAGGAVRARAETAGGVFRLRDIPAGTYGLRVEGEGFETLTRDGLRLGAGEVVTLELTLTAANVAAGPSSRLPRSPSLGPPLPPEPETPVAAYREFRRRAYLDPAAEIIGAVQLPPADRVFIPLPDRWTLAMPQWDRYGRGGEYPYVRHGHWWDPFNRNRLKGDEPIFGRQTFLNLTATSDTFLSERRVPAVSNVSAAQPGSSEFFGKGEQFALSQTVRVSADLFHGDASFRPADWRVRVTPAVNLNYLNVRELGVVHFDVRRGTARLDSHAGLQEGFVEYKLRDLSHNYDFLSVRAGIQGFSSDFRGFLFVEEQPGLRLFGTLHSNRWEYNAAYFNLLEKDTNSRLNTFARRRQQVIVANLYLQDFLSLGYTTQFSVHFNKDDASVRYDDNGFLVRPAPVGAAAPHGVRVGYLGWTGNGHFGRINVNHAFYQALGTDDLNPVAGRRVTVNAQMAAAEISIDKDWSRYKLSAFFASGDGNPRDDRATGFDSIVDAPVFAGGIFSFWNREGLRLTSTAVSLNTPASLLPSLRTRRDQGQANFVNPGIFIVNAGADFDLTPKLKAVVNVNYLRFERTAPLELLLFLSPVHNTIGVDSSLGLVYRPPLSENLVITAGASALSPGQGLRDMYTGKTLFSLFGNVKLQF